MCIIIRCWGGGRENVHNFTETSGVTNTWYKYMMWHFVASYTYFVRDKEGVFRSLCLRNSHNKGRKSFLEKLCILGDTNNLFPPPLPPALSSIFFMVFYTDIYNHITTWISKESSGPQIGRVSAPLSRQGSDGEETWKSTHSLWQWDQERLHCGPH